MKLTRTMLLKVIDTEPLAAGMWVRNNNPDCPTCALGGLVRMAGVTEELHIVGVCSNLTVGNSVDAEYWDENGMRDLDRIEDIIAEYVYNKKYFNAISIKFETLCSEIEEEVWEEIPKGHFIRRELAKWAIKNLPEDLGEIA